MIDIKGITQDTYRNNSCGIPDPPHGGKNSLQTVVQEWEIITLTYPNIDNARFVLLVEGHLKNIAEAGVEQARIVSNLDAAPVEGGAVGAQLQELGSRLPARPTHLLQKITA